MGQRTEGVLRHRTLYSHQAPETPSFVWTSQASRPEHAVEQKSTVYSVSGRAGEEDEERV